MDKMTEFEVGAMTSINAMDIVNSLREEKVIDLIKEIDGYEANWDFTEALYKYFSEQHQIYLMENCK